MYWVSIIEYIGKEYSILTKAERKNEVLPDKGVLWKPSSPEELPSGVFLILWIKHTTHTCKYMSKYPLALLLCYSSKKWDVDF